MPIQKCKKDGKSGYKWGKKGSCTTGKNARKKVEKQAKAIYAQKNDKKKKAQLRALRITR